VKRVREHNQEVIQKYRNGSLHSSAVNGSFEPEPKRLKTPSQSWARYWRSQWGWSMLTRGSNDQEWLPFGHPDMANARQMTKELFTKHGVHPGLVLNFDQLWRACWCTSRYKLAYKPRQYGGIKTQKKKAGPRYDKKIHTVKGSRRSMTAS